MNTDERLLGQLADHLTDTFPEWDLDTEGFEAAGHRVASPVEPCGQCGKRVWLLLPKGLDTPVWLMWGELKGIDSLFPRAGTKRHTCGDGESWSVEAALFVANALDSWAVTG